MDDCDVMVTPFHVDATPVRDTRGCVYVCVCVT